MKKTFVLILCLAFSAFSAEKEMKKKLIIHLKKPIIKLSDAKSEFTLNAIKISDESLKKTLDELDIQTIKRTVPSFKMENHTKENLNNKFFQISDLSLIYTISFKPDISKIEEYKNALSKLDNIKMVEFVYQYENTDETIIPNDDRFKYTDNNSNGVYNFGTDTPGRQWGLFDYYVSNPQNRADVSMPEAWDFSTGSSNIKIGFVESTSSAYEGDPINGITELKGRNSGSNGVSWGDNSHSVATAGIAIANTNNDHLVAGVDWNAKYYSAAHGNNSEEFASAIQSCVNENCNVINNSWSIEAGNDGSYSTMLAIRNAYFNGSFVVAAMGNNNGSQDRVPACYSDIVFSVASANKSNNYSSFSNHNSYVDVTAPGGTNSSSQYDDICVITGDDDVDYMYGTSFSTPLVSGVASLMMSMREDVRAEDVEYILKHTADDIYLAGFDNFTGYGKINAKEAIRRLSSIYNMERYTTNGGTIIQVDNDWKTFVLYADFYTCVAKKYRIEKNISFNNYNQSTILIWGNIDGTLGVAPSNPNYQIPWCGVKEGTITSSSATIQTYVYKCKELYYPYQTFWYPCEPSEVEFAYTVLGDPPPSTPSISLGTQWDPDMHINHPKLTITRGSEDTDEYNIYRMKNGSSFDVVATISCSGTTTTWVDEIIMSTQYYGDNWWYKVKAKDDFGSESDFSNTVYTKGVQVDSSMNKDEPITLEIPELPSGYSLSAFPNPFNPTTNFKIGLPEAGNVKLSVYNSIGQNVFKFDEYREAGYQNIVFEAKNLNAGVYFYRLNVKNYSKSGKILYVK